MNTYPTLWLIRAIFFRERGGVKRRFCFEEDKEELRQLIDQHVHVDWSSSNREGPDEDLVLEVTNDVSEVTNDIFEEQLQNTTPPALPSSQSSCDEEALEVVSEQPSIIPYTLPPRSIKGKPKLQYCPDLNAKSNILLIIMCLLIDCQSHMHLLSINYLLYVFQVSGRML